MTRKWIPAGVLVLSTLAGTTPVIAAAIPGVHPVNMVSGIDSVRIDLGNYACMFYTVPAGQTLVLTDMTIDPQWGVMGLYDSGAARYVIRRDPSAGDPRSGSLSLNTGLVFHSGHEITFYNEGTPSLGVTHFSWSGYLVPEVVGVAPSQEGRQFGFSLSPNPTGQTVTLEFELTRPTDVRLGIYDVQGRLVRMVAKGSLPAGVYMETWDGTTEGGSEAASGVYFARLESKEAKSVRRLVRVR